MSIFTEKVGNKYTMRVVSGSARGRRLKEPGDMKVRPTTDKVKESMFNIIQFYIPDALVLDLFAGTGQLGIEALSRGAERVDFVDESNASLALVRDNLTTTGFEKSAQVFRADSIAYLDTCGKYDIILLDPPYDTPLIDKALKKINEIDILNKNGIIICETKFDRQLPEILPPYEILREYKYGKIKLTLIQRQE